MQPEQPRNLWENKSDETNSDKITEMYQPEPMPEETKSDDSNYSKKPLTDNNAPIHWSAGEYVNNEKNGPWFAIFAVVVIGLITLDIFVIKSYTFSALVVVMAIAVIVMSRRSPRLIDYTLSGNQGLYIGERLYHFSEFKAFSLIEDRGQHSIMMIPTKRFSPGVIFYFPTEVGEKIVDILGARLPMENRKLDIIDIIVQKLKL
jgi:hypothetical protein